MATSGIHGVTTTISGVWRAHTVLDESDEADGSPDMPDRFRKRRSSSTLNSLRTSLRRRLPLKPVQTNVAETPTWESLELARKPNALRLLTRSARNSVSDVYQKLQKSRISREECLVATPGKVPEGEENRIGGAQAARTPQKPTITAVTPKQATRRTPRSGAKRTIGGGYTPERSSTKVPVRAGGSRRQLVRMAALRSPFASPGALSRRRQFDQDLESVSSGLKKLKRLSQAFDDVIGRDDRTQAMENYHRVMVRSYRMTQKGPSCRISGASIRGRTKSIQEAVGSWTGGALSNIRKPT